MTNPSRSICSLSALLCCTHYAMAQDVAIRLNQVGYTPSQEKVAVVVSDKAQRFKITDMHGKTVMTGKTKLSARSPFSPKTGWRIDFSQLSQTGEYTITIGNTAATFNVTATPLQELGRAAMKAFYYQRSGIPIEAKYAGQWARGAAHPDTQVLIHPSAASAMRPAGTVISSPGGWYDAGDYNKYIVNSAFTIGQMLGIWPVCDKYYESLSLNIPESGNGAPDILSEIYYNLSWMLTMQDPADGGVYHKLTTPNFEAFIMPTECKQQRYVVQKSTCASLDFAACMAMAARIYAKYEQQFPGFALAATNAACRAYEWAQNNPNVLYNQDNINQSSDPDVNTGTYGDFKTDDEFLWAATELWLTTGDTRYHKAVSQAMPTSLSVPSWGNVSSLALISLLLQQRDAQLADRVRQMLTQWCDTYIKNVEQAMYLSPFGNKASDFHWASIAEGVCTEGTLLCLAYHATGDERYLTNAQRNIDYMLGRNATGYCYVTGFGTRSPMHPHHRLSFADGIEAPIPGLLVGGPNAHPSDGVQYPSTLPDESYADDHNSYTTNEIAINWNSALVAITALLQSKQPQ